MIYPNFLIVGAAKAGTTALYENLKKHPEVFMTPMKEPNFFSLENHSITWLDGTVGKGYAENFIYTLDDYLSLFKNAGDKKAIGEASPMYLYDKNAAATIRGHFPEMKIIIILRNPADRAFSNFVHHLRINAETTRNFEKALKLEEERIKMNWWWGFHYRQAGCYYEQVKSYYNTFPEEQIKVIIYDDWLNRPEDSFKEILVFLDVDQSFIPDLKKKYKVSSLVKNNNVEDLLKVIDKSVKLIRYLYPKNKRNSVKRNIAEKLEWMFELNRYKPSLNPDMKAKLLATYEDDIKQLEKLIQKDLSRWYEPGGKVNSSEQGAGLANP